MNGGRFFLINNQGLPKPEKKKNNPKHRSNQNKKEEGRGQNILGLVT